MRSSVKARRPGAGTTSILTQGDPFKATIDALLAERVWNAEVIFVLLKEQGYSGGITLVRDYMQPKRPLRQQRQTVRFETAPGRQLQHDWGEQLTVIAGAVKKISFAVNTLGYSRRFHVWATDSEDAEHTYESLVRSFEYFGGVTEEVLVDYVPGNIIWLMWPSPLCAREQLHPAIKRWCS